MLGLWVALGAAAVLAVLWMVRPVLGRMGAGYAVQRRRQTALVVAGLMIATTVIAAAGIASDSAGRSFTESLLGRLELTDVILDGSHGAPAPAEEVEKLAADRRLAGLEAMSLGIRTSLAFEDASSGRGDDSVTVWGIDPATYGRVASLDGIEGVVPATLSQWAHGTAFVNQAAQRQFGVVPGDDSRLYLVGKEAVVDVESTYEGHFVLALAGPEGAGVHHPDNVHRFTFNTTQPYPMGPLRFSLRGPADTTFTLRVASPSGQEHVAGPQAGGANLTIEEHFGAGAQYHIVVDADVARDVAFQVDVTEARRVILEATEASLRITGIVEQSGSEPVRNDAAIYVPLPMLQDLLRQPGRVNMALLGFAEGTDLQIMQPVLEEAGRDAWGGHVLVRNDRAELERERADLEKAVRFTFLGIGSFSIIAGVMLIFVMLALLVEERKRILATSRAVGAQRRDLSLMHAHEGSVYSLLAAVAGFLGATVLAVGLSGPMQAIFAAEGGRFVLVFRPATVLSAVGFGFVFTLVVIVLAAHRSSRFHIAAALKGEERETRGGRVAGALAGTAVLVVGLLVTLVGSGSAFGLVLGPCLAALGAAGVLARFLPRGATFAAVGAAVSLYLVASFWLVDVSDDDAEFLLFPIRGVLLAVSLAMVAAYSSWLHGLVVAAANRFGRAGAYVEAALGHVRQRPGRAALTISMFATVLVILTTLGTLFATFEANDLGDTGGYDVLGDTTLAIDPPEYLRQNPPASGADPFGHTRRWVATPFVPEGVDALEIVLRDDEDGRRTTSPFAPFSGQEAEAAIAVHPGSGRDLPFRAGDWGRHGSLERALEAVARDPGLIIANSQLEYYDFEVDERRPIPVGTRMGIGRDGAEVTVTARVHDTRAFGVLVHADTLQAMAESRGLEEPGTRIWAEARGMSDTELAEEFASAFRRAGMVTVAASSVDPEEAAVGGAFQTMIGLFLGLGIVIGMVSLALIMGRNVLLRRAEVGSLRALGATPEGILGMFSFEALYVSLFSIGIGLGVGLLLAWATVRSDAIFVPLRIDWGALLLLYGATILAALAAAFLPAWKASRIPPAEAVRYTE